MRQTIIRSVYELTCVIVVSQKKSHTFSADSNCHVSSRQHMTMQKKIVGWEQCVIRMNRVDLLPIELQTRIWTYVLAESVQEFPFRYLLSDRLPKMHPPSVSRPLGFLTCWFQLTKCNLRLFLLGMSFALWPEGLHIDGEALQSLLKVVFEYRFYAKLSGRFPHVFEIWN